MGTVSAVKGWLSSLSHPRSCHDYCSASLYSGRANRSRSLWLSCILAVFGLLSCSNIVIAQTDLSEVLNQAVQQSGPEIIHSATIHFDITIADAAPTAQELTTNTQKVRQAVTDLIDKGENPLLVEQLKSSLVTLDEDVKQQLTQNAQRDLTGTYRFLLSENGEDEFIRYRLRRGFEQSFGTPMTLLSRTTENSQKNILFDEEANLVSVTAGKLIAGVERPHYIGRLQGGLLARLRSGEDDSTLALRDISHHSETEDGLITIKILLNETMIGKVQVDTNRGYVCPLVEEFDENEQLIRSWRCDQFVRLQGSEFWFPETCLYKEITPIQPGVFNTVDYKFQTNQCRLNSPVQNNNLSLMVEEGTAVATEQASYIATCAFELSLTDLNQLSNLPCLQISQVAKLPVKETLKPKSPAWSSWLFWMNVSLLLFLAGILALKYKLKSRST